ncbi:MAG: hypothetical protein GY951_03485 [Psychromonas sp.]|nr:hypothetical protein [Alteromonadales bacterium]MCP5077102.1 hypothetical protein [Psychromonas sp.]
MLFLFRFCSPQYTELVIKKMEKHLALLEGSNYNKLEATINLLRKHKKAGTLEYKMVIQTINKETSELTGVIVKSYAQVKKTI